ncbi:MAG: AAA family ATPase [bacterium]|nr:AAA family ATPase [bacterium]
MYITGLRIQNVKLLRDFQLSFGSHDEPRMWTVLISANGLCKTAILQCIAMAASGHVRSNQLADVAALPDLRTESVARIGGHFSFGALGHSRRSYPALPEEDRSSMPGLLSSIVIAPGETGLLGNSQYFTELSPSSPRFFLDADPARVFRPGQPLTSEILHEEGLIDALAIVFDSEASALGLLDTIGFPKGRQPAFHGSTPIEFWQAVGAELDKGLIQYGLGRLLTAAARFYPHNPKFNRWATDADRAENLFHPLEVVRAKDLADWFVAGYGTSRLLPRPLEEKPPESPSVERISTLFNQGRIIGTEFARILDDTESFNAAVNQALIEARLLPMATGVTLRENGWARSADDRVKGDLVTLRQGTEDVEVPATWLSQGYQSTISWIADLVGWFYFERQEPVPLAEMEGLVLIDEIDLHLHPSWQADLIPVLKRVFPRLQFVVTTHSPMVLTGLKPEEIVILSQDEDGNVVPEQIDDVPALMTGSQIYDRYYGLRRVEVARLAAALRRHEALSEADPSELDEEDREELASLRDQLVAAGIDLETGRPR